MRGLIALFVAWSMTLCCLDHGEAAGLRVGAAVTDITPETFPVFVNGGMLSRSVSTVNTPVNARAIVLDNGAERVAIVIVDSCMVPRPLADDVKAMAHQQLGYRTDRILISATHTHTAPACMSCLGTDADPAYVPYLRRKLVEAIAAAEDHLEPAHVGWAVTNAAEYTALRRWIRRPDRIAIDPFGNPTVRANMHAGRNWDDVTGESGPEDPDFSMISFVSPTGRPIALLGNFSMHYFGDKALSADYFGLFCNAMQSKIVPQPAEGAPPFVVALSHGCSGDIWRRDYTKPPEEQNTAIKIDEYTDGLVQIALDAYRKIQHVATDELVMSEARMELRYRTPDVQRLEWSRRIVEAMGDRPPKDRTEVYAREQIILHERQSTEIVVQALRIGKEIAIATTPNETYALTGLKIKKQSPIEQTMVIELANGGDGYIPPPEQHLLGGYNTWPARSAGLEVQAEPKIAAMAIHLLEKVAGRPRRDPTLSRGPAAQQILAFKPVAYWRLEEFAGPRAVDSSGNHRDAIYEPGTVFYLAGPRSEEFCSAAETNRAAHFAGGRLNARIDQLDQNYTVSLWVWNGMPSEARDVTGWFLSRGPRDTLGSRGDHLGLGGKANSPGRLLFLSGEAVKTGQAVIPRWTWTHIALVREGNLVKAYVNGVLDLQTEAPTSFGGIAQNLFLGGRCDNNSNWEGRLDEIAVFNRALTPKEIRAISLAQ